MDISLLIIPAFIAGILTFLAPCTLPLVPAYLSFISGSSVADLQNPATSKKARSKIFLNGLLYVVGFSAVFIVLGSLFGLGGAALLQYRFLITRIGGLFVILFGIFLLAPQLPMFRFLLAERQVPGIKNLKPGNPVSSLIFGSAFAFGWSPCVGPILGTVLTLAASTVTVGKGALLLVVFSLGLAVPFLATALAIGWASQHLAKLGKYLNIVSAIGGVFLILLGIVMVTDNFALWIAWMYQLFGFINYESLLEYL
ncbi:MAG: sulfite exporter TauE/SafE family protein [Candidatus Wildermuthbacteria bacterium]|nr:sulfite exporter TauE/SafE family protein [Candidatus Wildermuthbacteria bacterium]